MFKYHDEFNPIINKIKKKKKSELGEYDIIVVLNRLMIVN